MKSFILIPSLLAGLCCSAMAAPFVFNDGDVVIGFQATAGEGSTENVFFRIGSGTALRDGALTGTIGNINATLTATYGANWYKRTDLYCGAIGNLNASSPGFPIFTPVVNGDPSQTVYLTKPATYPRTGEIIDPATYPGAALGSVGTKFSGMEAMVLALTAEADTSAVLDQGTQPVEWNNGWTTWNPIPGAAFDTITGGLQQNFGKNTPATFLDLQRVLATNSGAAPTGVVGGGEYVATIHIEADGTIKVLKTPLPVKFYFNDGDVVLGFQATAGTGSDKNVFFRLGAGTGLRDGTVTGELGNIASVLTATYGADWYRRSDLFCGAIGNLNASSAGFPIFTSPVNGDPSQTIYLTKPATYPRTGETIAPATYPGAALGSVGTKFSGMEAMLASLPFETNNIVVLDQNTQPVEWNNSWTTWNPIPGAAFDTISGGLQQNFGKNTPATFLDLQRVLATNTGAVPTGTVGGSEYVTTIHIEPNGTIKALKTSLPLKFYFNDGDVVLGFQATSGTGSDKNVFFRLGAGTDLRDGPASGNLGNIGSSLAATYGSNWYSRSDLHFGAIGNLNASTPGFPIFTPPVNGDPAQTTYLSKPASFPKEGEIVAAGTYVSSALGSVGTKFSGMEAMVVTLAPETDYTAVLDEEAKPVEWNNGWSTWNPVPGPAFDTITGGLQQTFGKPAPSTYLDLQRVLATNTNANPTGVVGGGTYVTTIEVDSNGNVKLASTTAFQTWINSFTALTSPDDRITTADPDNDSYTNFEEFAFGGDPGNPTDNGIRKVRTVDANNNSIPDLTLTVEVRSGATFTNSGGAMLATIDNVTYRIEGSPDLTSWTSTVSEVNLLGSDTPSPGYVLKTFRLNAAEGFPSKGFLRAGVVK